MKLQWIRIVVLAVCWTLFLALMRTCNNNPWGDKAPAENTLFTTFSQKIRNLDPIAANFVHENAVIDNLTEAPLAYHYLKRPYKLIPMLLEEMPTVNYYDADGKLLEGDPDTSEVARAECILHIKPGIFYVSHPCFDASSKALVDSPKSPWDFGPNGQRELIAEDFLVSMNRLCDPRSNCTVFSQLGGFLEGMGECRRRLSEEIESMDRQRMEQGESAASIAASPSLPDYRVQRCECVQVLDRYTVKYVLSRKYPQFLYWLTMHYFTPIPFEAFEFYGREDVASCGLSYANWPVGTGAYKVTKCDLDSQIVLERNPDYHEFYFPTEGEEGDELDDAGRRLPFIDKVVFQWEPESIPSWTKFQQGYYDNSGLPTDMFDKALSMNPTNGELSLSPDMAERGIGMTTMVPPISYYYAFNMKDPIVGDMGERGRALRQALSMVIDTRQYVTIFRNGNGVAAGGILPPGLFGAAEPPTGMNTVINDWNGKSSERKSLAEAKRLLAAAGYPNGISEETGEPLVIHLDHAAAGLPDFKNKFRWLADKFALLGVKMEERGTDLNTSRQRLAEGNWQFLYERGWVADYPDPENFLMLFAGENGQVEYSGPNYANYSSKEYDAIFSKLESMPNCDERLELINQANEVLYRDAPVVWDFHPINMILTHGWLHNYVPPTMAYDNLKYLRLDVSRRVECLKAWNPPCTWPAFALMVLVTIIVLLPHSEERR
ncbi:MAG: ABC transporter substrate-binding protein [Lentisphaeria bacterium]|nr:ABC transporter substrate-binding protein [Lentisphaeria bacterium]